MDKKKTCCYETSPDTGSCSSEEDAREWIKRLPAIGVFWDIENCQVPRGKSAAVVAQTIRSRFFSGHREVEFLVVCDVTKENPRIIEELNCAKVNLIHVSATCKNAADDKLRQRIRHFGETYSAGSTLLLISGDINFSSELIELRHRRMMRIVLVHNQNTSEALKICANENYKFSELLENLPEREDGKEEISIVELLVYNIPEYEPPNRVRLRLKQLCSNCGGRVGFFARNLYYVRFPSIELAVRAQRRMDGQDVFGRRISVSEPRPMDWSRTPGRNRPKQPQEELVKPWDSLLAANTHTPTDDDKVYGFESLLQTNTVEQQQKQLQNNLRKATMNATHTANLAYRLNNHCDDGSKGVDYRTDSSSGACDDDDDDLDSDNEEDRLRMEKTPSGPVDLRVTGFDCQQDPQVIRAQLLQVITKYVKPMNLAVFTQKDGIVVASVRLKNLQDSQLVIANLQRVKMGNHRIKIAFNNASPEQRHLLRQQVAELLAKIPDAKMPLFRFKELFKNEYLTSISVSELRRMRDVCIVGEDGNGRMISANPTMGFVSPMLQSHSSVVRDGAYCDRHYRPSPNYFAEPQCLPNISIRLGLITERIQILLHSHNGRLPIASLDHCYTARFGNLPISQEEGVPFEHLVSCLPGIEIIQTQASHKILTFVSSQDKPVGRANFIPNDGLSSQLLELFKAAPKATLSFSSIIPAYHRRFGKQFRLSDFGFTKLLDLLESMPYIVQVMGFGCNKQVTISHKAQIKRFKIDLLKVLKTLPRKTIELTEFPMIYCQIFSKLFEPWQYGLCDLEDLISCCVGPEIQLSCLETGKLQVTATIRDQTPEELALTNRFKSEVVELLKHYSDCSMPFKKFVPVYHNYFSKQCRVACYGFHRLIDLFETITDTVTVEESATTGEKLLVLVLPERLKILGERICKVVASHGGTIMLADLENTYQMFQFGVIDPVQYESDSLMQLMNLLNDYVKVVSSPHGYLLQAVPPVDAFVLDLRTRCLLLSRDRLSVEAFRAFYAATYGGSDLNVELTISRIPHTARIISQDGVRQVQLTPRAVFANQVYTLLYENGGRMALINLENAFSRRFGSPITPSTLGSNTITALLASFPETIIMRAGQPTQSYLQINPSIKDAGFPLPMSGNTSYSLWEGPALFGSRFNVTPPSASCLPIPTDLLKIKPNNQGSQQLNAR